MVDRETLKECQVCLIGYLLKNIKDIDKLSITKDYLKDFSIQGKKYNFKYIFEKIAQIHKENRDNDMLQILSTDEQIDMNIIMEIIQGNPLEQIGAILSKESTIIQAHKEDLLKEAYNKLKNGECDINEYTETVKQINELGIVKQAYITENDLKECLSNENIAIKGLGFPTLESYLNMKQKDFMLIYASTGGGKTALALNLLSNLSKHYPCIYFNMEMAEQTMYERLVSIQSGVPMETLERYKYITDKELKNRIDEAMKEIGEHKRITMLTGGKSIQAIQATINKLDPKEHTIVFIDHVGLITGVRGSSQYEKITELAKTLRNMTMAHNITMIALSQVSRSQNQQGNTRNRENEPLPLSRLKDSGELENSARQAVNIYFKTEGNYFVYIAKSSSDGVGKEIPITFTKNIMTIRER
ncbi:DnaB-like helicase C-terminal domain-containing protein [Catenibacterium sp.]|uniref:DnaB-like helicase C-terminal domain-containing protein n=1 Tax=Catenibacterium sp. TaxID=2049022 RepID=UPI002E77D598|nr:DnaB-like helicase C-terminal domain-containing protein [Catenibacterium sp.]MEE0819950.1 DnaB-like helicase C-terminal domain-containing protein [Catenibacterium sp.]